jgi:hypothetical protein
MSKSLVYKEADFDILTGDDTGDSRVAYLFESNDRKIQANFFFLPGDVQTRGLIFEGGDPEACFDIAYPFANPIGNPQKIPEPDKILRTVIRKLKRGEYE